MQVTPGLGGALPGALPAGPGGGLPTSPGATALALPSMPPVAGLGANPLLALPAAAPARATAGTPRTLAAGQPLDIAAHGVGASWLVFLTAVSAIGGLLLPRVPALARARSSCHRERPYPISREL